MPEDFGHREKWLPALDIVDELADWGMVPPVVVADAGYGQNADFRAALEDRGLPYVMAVRSNVTARSGQAVPTTPPWSGTGRKPQPRYRQAPTALAEMAAESDRQSFSEVTWRQGGSRGAMGSRFLALRIRPAGGRGPPSGPGGRPRGFRGTGGSSGAGSRRSRAPHRNGIPTSTPPSPGRSPRSCGR